MSGFPTILSGLLRRGQAKAGLTMVLLSGIGMAFADSVSIYSPQSGEVISGNYTLSGGWSLDPSSVTGVEVWVGNSGLSGVTWNDGGWSVSVDTNSLSQGPGQTVSVQVDPLSVTSSTSGVVVDQPPTIQLISTPPAGGGDGQFTFRVKSYSGTGNVQWINGMISATLGSTPLCSFSYWPTQGGLTLLGDNGVWGPWGDIGTNVGGNSQCQIVGYGSSYVLSGDGVTATLTLNLKFLAGLQGTERIYLITSDQWLDSGQQDAGYWSTLPAPVVSSFTPTSGNPGTPVTITGSNFGDAQSQWSRTVTFNGVAATSVTSWAPGAISTTVPIGATTGPVAVTVNGGTGTGGTFTVPSTPPTVVLDPLPTLISGSHWMSGLAVDMTSTIDPNAMQIYVDNIPVQVFNFYGYYRSECISQYPGWPGCPNIGWASGYIDTSQLPQGPNQLVAVYASTPAPSSITGVAESTVIIDQPPTMQLTSTPPAGRGNGLFTFTVKSFTGVSNLLWINGVFDSTLGALPECSFSFWPSGNGLALTDDSGTQWSNWIALGTGPLSNSECRIEADSTYTPSPDGMTAVLSLDITFLGGLQGLEQLTMITSDQWLTSGFIDPYSGHPGLGWNTVVPAPTISSFFPPSAMVGGQITLNGANFASPPGTCGTVTLGGNTVPAANVTCTASTMVVKIPSNAATGSISVTTNSGTGTYYNQFFQLLTADFSMSASASSITTSGGSAAVTLTFQALNGFNANVGLTPTSSPAATVSLVPNSNIPVSGSTPINQLVYVNVSQYSAATFTLTIMAASPGGVAHTVTVTVNVPAAAISGFTPASAPQGVPLSIIGSGFGTTHGTVFLGGVQVADGNITSWSDGSIGLMVPATAKSGLVSVTVGSVTAQSSSKFTYVPADFTMSPPGSVTAYPTGIDSGSFTEVISGANFTGSVNLTYSVDSGVAGRLTLSKLPKSVTLPDQGTFTAFANALVGTPAGTWKVVITATGTRSDLTTSSQSATLLVTVTDPAIITMSSPSPSPVIVSSSKNITFTQTITAVNGFTGAVGFTVPYNPQCWGGQPSFSSATLSALNPSATVTGTMIANDNLNNSPAAYLCEVDAIGNFPGGKLMLYVPVQVTAGSTFTVNPVAPITLYVGSPAIPLNLQVNPVNGYSNNVTFTTSTQNIRLLASTVYVNAPTTVPITVQWTGPSVPPGTQVPISVAANGNPVLTIIAIILPNPATSFSLSASPGSVSTNSAGGAAFQINVNASSAFKDTVYFSVSGLPAGSWSFSPQTVTGAGATVLTVTPPAGTTPGPYPFSVTGTSGNVTSLPAYGSVTVNPPSNKVAATMSWPVDGSLIPSRLTSGAPFSWTKGVGVTSYALTISYAQNGSNIRSADFRSSTPGASMRTMYVEGQSTNVITYNFPSTTQSVSVGSLPTDGRTITVSLVSVIGTTPNPDPDGPQHCPSGGDGGAGNGTGPVSPTRATTTQTVGILNDNSPQNPSGDVKYYTYNLDQGDARDISKCYQQGYPNNDGPVVAQLGPIGVPNQSGQTRQFQIGFSALDTTPAQQYSIYCKWDNPDDGTIYALIPVSDSIGAGVTVYDATPVITDAGTKTDLYAGDQSGTVALVINGHNFGKSGQLAFCPTSGPSCDPNNLTGDGLITYTYDPKDWSPESITAWLKADQNAGTSYDVMVVSTGASGLGNGYLQAGPQTTSKAGKQKTAVPTGQAQMKLELANPAAISADGSYSEDATIRLTAVRRDGSPIVGWNGTVYLGEDISAQGYQLIYTATFAGFGPGLPVSINISNNGTLSCQAGCSSNTFLARSLAEPQNGNLSKPNNAKIKTNNFAVYGGSSLDVPQWIVTNQIDQARTLPGTYDWMASQMKDISTSATSDDGSVLASVSYYYIGTTTTDSNGNNIIVAGYVLLNHNLRSPIFLNPYYPGMRSNSLSNGPCGYNEAYNFTGTAYHEARHAYQSTLATLGTDSDWDFLIYDNLAGMPSAPTVRDSTDPRDVCDELGTKLIVHGWKYHGDNVEDQYYSPDWSSWAFEKDAFDFEANRAIKK